MEEKKSKEITFSAVEDLSILSAVHFPLGLTALRFGLFMLLSVSILGVYLLMNTVFFPGYPVITPNADGIYTMAEHYPPFRLDEWSGFSITKDMLEGKLHDSESLSRKHPLGFSLLCLPLTAVWGKAGPYYTNAFILWFTAILYFFLLFEMLPFPIAIISTFFLAFATPNLFYAASAFSETASQTLIILTLLLFLRGVSEGRNPALSFFCGLTAGLNLFFQPVMALIIIPILILLFLENGKWTRINREFYFHAAGFMLPFIVFLILNKNYTGEYIQFIFSMPYNLYDPSSYRVGDPQTNWFLKIWKVILDNPLGIIYLMPAAIMVPYGFLVMWRNDRRELAILCVSVIFLVILQIISTSVPITRESLGSRLFVPVLPLLVLPLAFLWEEGRGEKILLTVLAVLTVYMCSLGWWTGTNHGTGVLPGILQDREARYILLSRKGMLKFPVFYSKEEISKQYLQALKDKDIKRWLETLDKETLTKVLGNEREIFFTLTQKIKFSTNKPSNFIESANPSKGIRAVIPDNGEPEQIEYFE
jgi:hypothetical protein